MTWAERLQSVFVAVAALAGLGVGLASPLGANGEHLVIPALLVMLIAVFMQLDASHLKDVGKAKGLVGVSLVLNYAFTPLLAWALGLGLLGAQPDLRIGLLLLLVTPCTDWYLIFTAMARGHAGIAAALLPINLVLQLLLLPVYVMLLGGEAAMVDTATLLEAVLLMLLTPLVVAFTLRWVSTRLKGEHWREEHVNRWANRVVMPLLCVAVFAMFAWQAPVVAESGAEMLLLLPPLLAFFIILPLVATGVSRLLRLTGPQRVALTMVTTARNSPIALGIAVAAFPDRPLIAVALVVGPLIELPILAALSQIIRHRDKPDPAEQVPATSSDR
ncbi:arsenic resistance protein [Nesterenkonia sp. E16_7]|uniref:Arsenic resistance protein n=1 Tax=Nesterenkonia cremea TaxID=1882340 RepID=A0A917AVB1_9MICC|nr:MULTISPECIES: bile acid:sodium symporter [Micrococcaceae]MBO0596298.1 arsenic resistance protein [Nesterenkonia sp. E16_10]MBO0599998.1 arsenic resistance protein [Nesterenkonia sp. E16_7]WBL20292.1 bile acid:sodium symporter [Citricoccus sp. NR2]GGE78993.1 arsenic resistance protein [Nesterenkonia cremea]